MKYIVFSFDDARADTYTRAYPILKKHSMPFTINAVSDFVTNPNNYKNFVSGNNNPMTAEQLRECQDDGVEIACHGHTHNNTKQDVLDNIASLRDMGLQVDGIGFASPNSAITAKNGFDVKELLKSGELSYIRSGIQIRREGLLYTALSIAERITHSPRLFYLLNKRNIIRNKNAEILMSVAITRYTTNAQILYLLKKLQDSEAVILMFHSILYRAEPGYGADSWYFDANRFTELCKAISNDKSLTVSTTKDMLNAL